MISDKHLYYKLNFYYIFKQFDSTPILFKMFIFSIYILFIKTIEFSFISFKIIILYRKFDLDIMIDWIAILVVFYKNKKDSKLISEMIILSIENTLAL